MLANSYLMKQLSFVENRRKTCGKYGYVAKSTDLRDRWAWALMPSLLFIGCVTLGELMNLFEPPFLHH